MNRSMLAGVAVLVTVAVLACAQPAPEPTPENAPPTPPPAPPTPSMALDELCAHRLACWTSNGTQMKPWRLDRVGRMGQADSIYRLEVCYVAHTNLGAHLVLISTTTDAKGGETAHFRLVHSSQDTVVAGRAGLASAYVKLAGDPLTREVTLDDGCGTNSIRNEQAGDFRPYGCPTSGVTACTTDVVCTPPPAP